MTGSGLYDMTVHAHPEPTIADLVPEYLERRHADITILSDALVAGDMERLRVIGHSMKGSGGGYGFDGITEIGLRLEDAGRASDTAAARVAIEDLVAYLKNVEVDDE
jgi:HPt (histidine-containing phosphotransfer) domain-containing protein